MIDQSIPAGAPVTGTSLSQRTGLSVTECTPTAGATSTFMTTSRLYKHTSTIKSLWWAQGAITHTQLKSTWVYANLLL